MKEFILIHFLGGLTWAPVWVIVGFIYAIRKMYKGDIKIEK